tara:strand:+ start:9857 stop:9991 length:135 start_codon:yes stop_codon:yes gene_type:complete
LRETKFVSSLGLRLVQQFPVLNDLSCESVQFGKLSLRATIVGDD